METTTFLEQLNALAASEDLLSVGREASDLRTRFDDFLIEEERKIQVDELEAQERGEELDTEERKAELARLKDDFQEAYQAFKAARKQQKDEREAIETRNLSEKMALIKRLKEVVTEEENIGAAFAALKEIQDKWKEIGEIPRAKRNEVETEYSHLLDDFFYNIKIYKELKEHDFHRNHQLKLELIGKLKKLNELESIREIEEQLKQLQDEWNDIGPVPNEEWENLKESYWTEVRSVYNKINRFYEDRRAQLNANIELKKSLLEELKSFFAEEEEDPDTAKAWDKQTRQVLDIQERWKKIGFGPRKENDQLFKELRALCDDFFGKKKAFFDGLHKEYDGVAQKKKELIDEAKALQTSTDWNETANQLKKLQRRWKDLGHSGVKHEQKLWKEFRAACDHFFTARQNHFSEQEQEQVDNLAKKEEIIARIKAYKPAEDKATALADLKAFSAEFNEVGHVPIKAKDKVYKEFKDAMDAHYGALKMDAAEKEEVMFRAKIELLQSSPNSPRLLRGMKDDIRKEIDRYTKEITQLENNLGFFSRTKGAEKLLKDVDNKVARYREKIDELKAQLKMIPNE